MNPPLFLSTNFDLQTCWKLSEMTLFVTCGVFSCRTKSFSHYTNEPKFFCTWEAHFDLVQKQTTAKANRKAKQSLNVVISLGSGVTIIPECHSSASPANGSDTQRSRPTVYTKPCRQEGSGLRKPLQSNPTLSSNHFISLVGIAKRHMKEMKGSHLTSNLVLSTQPRFILDMNRSQRASSQRTVWATAVPPIASLWRIHSLSSKAWLALPQKILCLLVPWPLAGSRERGTLPRLECLNQLQFTFHSLNIWAFKKLRWPLRTPFHRSSIFINS